MDNLAIIVEHQTSRSTFSCDENVVRVVQELKPAELKQLVTQLEKLYDQHAANVFVKNLATDIPTCLNLKVSSPCKSIWDEVYNPETAGMQPIERLQEASLTFEKRVRKAELAALAAKLEQMLVVDR